MDSRNCIVFLLVVVSVALAAILPESENLDQVSANLAVVFNIFLRSARKFV